MKRMRRTLCGLVVMVMMLCCTPALAQAPQAEVNQAVVVIDGETFVMEVVSMGPYVAGQPGLLPQNESLFGRTDLQASEEAKQDVMIRYTCAFFIDVSLCFSV